MRLLKLDLTDMEFNMDAEAWFRPNDWPLGSIRRRPRLMNVDVLVTDNFETLIAGISDQQDDDFLRDHIPYN